MGNSLLLRLTLSGDYCNHKSSLPCCSVMAENTGEPWKLMGSSSNPTAEMGRYLVKDFKYFKSSLNLVSEGMEMSMDSWAYSFPNRDQVEKEGFGLNI